MLGIQFVGPDDELYRALDNPNGFFERTSILDFSNTLLYTQGWAWDNVDLHPLNIEKASMHLGEARHIIEGLSNDGVVGVKDPRSCLVLPFWRRALLDRFEAVVITRDPAEVAWSLHVRDGIPVTAGLALYIAYSAHLAKGIQGLSSHVVRYEDLVNSPIIELGSVAQFLCERGVPVSQEESDIEVSAKSIDPTLRRATFPEWLETHPLAIEARCIRELFHQLPSGDISFTPSELCREVLDFQKATHELRNVNHQLHLARTDLHDQRINHQTELTQASYDYVNAAVTLEERINELSTANSELEYFVSSQKQLLEQTTLQLELTKNSFSFKLGRFLTWPIRNLRFSKRQV